MEEKATPDSQGNSLEQGTATSSQSLRSALSHTSSHETYIVYRSRIPVHVSRLASTGIRRPRQQPTAQQDQAHSMSVSASLEEQDPALPLLHETEPSQELDMRTPVGRTASQMTYVKYRSLIPVRVSRMVYIGIERPSQKPTAQPDEVHNRPVAASPGKQCPAPTFLHKAEPSEVVKTRTPLGRTASQETYVKYRSRIPVHVSRMDSTGIRRPTAQQEQARSMSVSAPLGRLPGTWHQKQVSEQDPAVFCVQRRQNLTGTSLPVRAKTGENLSTVSQGEHLKELNTGQLACTEHRLPLLREASPILQKLEKIPCHKRVLDWLEGDFQNHCDVLAQEEKQEQDNRPQELCQGNESNDKEQSQGDKDISYNLWDNPLILVNKLDPDTAAQEVSSYLSTSGPEAAAEAVADLPSMSSASASAMGSEPAGAALVRAPEAQEEAMATSPAFGEQVRPVGAESHAAALHSPCSSASPLPSWPEAYGCSGQQVGAAAQSVLSVPKTEVGALAMEERKDSLDQELSQGQAYRAQDLSQGEDDSGIGLSQQENERDQDKCQVKEDRDQILSSPAEEGLPVPAHQEAQAFGPVPAQALLSQTEAHGLSGPQAVRRQRPSRFRRALRALGRLCRCACVGRQPED